MDDSLEPAPPAVDSQLTAQLLDQILATAHPLLVEALYCAAVPHTYDVGLLTALRARQDGRDEKLAVRLAEFSFIRSVEPVESETPRYAVLAAERAILQQRFLASNPTGFVEAHQRALAYREAHPNPDPFLHDQSCLYHSLIATSEAGSDLLIALFRQYTGERRLAATERLIATAQETRPALATLQTARLPDLDDVLAYMTARLTQLRGLWAESLPTLQSLQNKPQLTPRLRPYVIRACGEALAEAEQYVEAISEYQAALKLFRRQPGTDVEQALTMLALGDAHVDLAVSARSVRDVVTPPAQLHFNRRRWLKDLLTLPVYLPLLIYLSLYFGWRVFRPVAWRILNSQDWMIARLFGLGMRWYRRADAVLQSTATGADRSRANEKIATLLLTIGDAAEAAPLFQAILADNTTPLGEYRRATVQTGLGQAQLRSGYWAAARDQLQTALPVLETYGDVDRLGQATGLLAEANLELGDRDAAIVQFGHALRSYVKQDDYVGATEMAERLRGLDHDQRLSTDERNQAITSAGELTRHRYLVRFQHPVMVWFRRSSLMLLALFIFLVPIATIYVETGSPVEPSVSFRASPLLDPTSNYSPDLTQGLTLNVRPTSVDATFALRFTVVLFLLYVFAYTVLGVGVIARTPLRTVQAAQAKAVQIDVQGITFGRGDTAHTLRWPEITGLVRADIRPFNVLMPDQSRTLIVTPTARFSLEGGTAHYLSVVERIRTLMPQTATITDLSYNLIRSWLGVIYLVNLVALFGFILLGRLSPIGLRADLLGTSYTVASLYAYLYLGITWVPLWWFVVRPLRILARFNPRSLVPWLVGSIGLALAVLRLITLNTPWSKWLTRPDIYPSLLSCVLMGSTAGALWLTRAANPPSNRLHWLRRLTVFVLMIGVLLMGERVLVEVVSQHFTTLGNGARDDGLAAKANHQAAQAADQFEAAIGWYDRALALFPQNAAVLDSRAALKAEVNRYEAAIADYGEALQYTVAQARVTLNRAVTYERWGDVLQSGGDSAGAQQKLAAAVADFDGLIAANPGNSDYYVWRGIVYHSQHQLAEALQDYQTALRLKPTNVNALVGQGWTYFGQADEASRTAQQLTDATLKAQLTASAQQTFTLALQSFQVATQLNPLTADNWLALGYAYYRLGNYADTLTAWNRALQIAPANPTLWTSRGTVYWKIANTPQSDVCSNQAASVSARADYARQLELAIDDFTHAVQLKPDDHFTYRTRAQVQYLLRNCPGYDFEQQLAAAIASYSDALKSAPDRFDYWQARARFGYVLGKHIFDRGPDYDAQAIATLDAAISDINQAVTLKPDDPGNKTWHSYIADSGLWRYNLLRGWDEYVAGVYTQSITDSLTAANLRLPIALPLFNAGVAALAMNDATRATQFYTAALQRAVASKDAAVIGEGLTDLNNLLKTRSDLASIAQPIVKKLQDQYDKLK